MSKDNWPMAYAVEDAPAVAGVSRTRIFAAILVVQPGHSAAAVVLERDTGQFPRQALANQPGDFESGFIMG